jgi:prepilin-type N-terminal cleavage/methylation domain-containing protein
MRNPVCSCPFHPNGGHGSRGFTLFEMVIVLAIIATLAAVVAPRITQLPTRISPPMIAFLETARQQAVATGKSTRILIEERRLRSTATGEVYDLAPEETLQVIDLKEDSYLVERELTAFYADGTMATSRFRLTTPTVVYLIEISPFDRRVRYTRAT